MKQEDFVGESREDASVPMTEHKKVLERVEELEDDFKIIITLMRLHEDGILSPGPVVSGLQQIHSIKSELDEEDLSLE